MLSVSALDRHVRVHVPLPARVLDALALRDLRHGRNIADEHRCLADLARDVLRLLQRLDGVQKRVTHEVAAGFASPAA